MDEQSDNEDSITHNKRAFKRPFVFLKQQIAAVPTRKHYETLEKDGRVKEIAFTKRHSAKEMGRLLLASFPELLGIELSRLTFLKSYNKGHSMDHVRHGLMSGVDLAEIFTGGTKNKVFFFVRSSAESSTSTGGPSSSHVPAPMVDLTTPPVKGGKSTRALLTKMAQKADQNVSDSDCLIIDYGDKDHVQMLDEEPEVVGDITVDLSLFGFSSEEKKKGGYGRTEEVAIACEKLMAVTGGSLPAFLTHSLDELLCQARLDKAVCLLVLFSNSSLPEREVYVHYLFKILNEEVQRKSGRFLFWLADSKSDEGNKVQAKYGLGDQTAVLILVPSHIPQCVEIFDETNIDRNKLKETITYAQKLCGHVQDEGNVTHQDAAKSAEQKKREEKEEKELAEEGKGKEEWKEKEAEMANAKENESAEQKKRKEKKEKQLEEDGKGKEEEAEMPNAKENKTTEQEKRKEKEEKELEEEGKGKQEEVERANEKENECNADDTSDEELEKEVMFGPGVRLDGVQLEDTLEDPRDETNPKKKKKKKKKKNKKRKNKGGTCNKADEPCEKKICLGNDGD